MTQPLSRDILDLADAVIGDGRHTFEIRPEAYPSLRSIFKSLADRACSLERDLACYEAIAREIDPHALALAQADEALSETDAEMRLREAKELLGAPDRPGSVIAFPVIARPIRPRPAFSDGYDREGAPA